MSKDKNIKKSDKKKPMKTMQEKKDAKRAKKENKNFGASTQVGDIV